jgi:hypothetical protein
MNGEASFGGDIVPADRSLVLDPLYAGVSVFGSKAKDPTLPRLLETLAPLTFVPQQNRPPTEISEI